MKIRIRSQRKLKKFAANLRVQLSGHIKKHGYDSIAKGLTQTLATVKSRSQSLRLKKNL
jgi:hypothetical protein